VYVPGERGLIVFNDLVKLPPISTAYCPLLRLRKKKFLLPILRAINLLKREEFQTVPSCFGGSPFYPPLFLGGALGLGERSVFLRCPLIQASKQARQQANKEGHSPREEHCK